MSFYHIITTIETEATERHRLGQDDAYQLEIHLRSGRKLTGNAWKSNSYYLKFGEEASSGVERVTYIAYDAIEQVTPIWL